MNFAYRLIGLLATSACLTVYGCGDQGTHSKESSQKEAEDNHDYHDHEPGAHEEDEDEHGHDGEESALGSVTVGTSVFEVTVGGEIAPEASLHVDIVHTTGPQPRTIRAWIGEESGVGSLKAKGDSDDGRFHVHVEVPAEMTDSMAFWVEFDNADGKRHLGSVPLK